jgi:uracil-DNA glycosylase
VKSTLPEDWRTALGAAVADDNDDDDFARLSAFVAAERARGEVFPPEADVFRAFELTPFDAVNVVIVGQDPYHDVGQAHGLAFSVKAPTKPPPSLRNIFKELHSDLGVDVADTGDLTPWAKRGVLLLNTVLTVRAHEPASHAGKGWERVTDAAIAAISARARPAVFCLWGNHAKKKAALVDRERHAVVEGAHPSPLSQKRFFGSRPFSAINAALVSQGASALDWRLP